MPLESGLSSTLLLKKRTRDGLHWNDYPSELFFPGSGLECTPYDAFTHIVFDNARLVRSNLGGQGGKCKDRTDSGNTITWDQQCDEHCDLENGICPNPAPELYVANAGVGPTGEIFDIRIRNESECMPPRSQFFAPLMLALSRQARPTCELIVRAVVLRAARRSRVARDHQWRQPALYSDQLTRHTYAQPGQLLE